MYKNLTITSLLGMLAIILGAFGAHALKSKLSADALQGFETAVRYQMYHVLLLLIINLNTVFSSEIKRKLTIIFIVGIVLFSGSIYALYLLNIPAKSIWFVTPLGGIVLIVGWVFLLYQFFTKNNKN